jgi:hypothetical protein
MADPNFWDMTIDNAMLTEPLLPLNEDQVASLWKMFVAVGTHWKLDIAVNLLRSRWLDLIEAKCISDPDYRAEYANAVLVYDAIVAALGEDQAIKLFYGGTIVDKPEQATTKLRHAKYYVGNEFIRCFIATGGFRGFVKEARNYTGFMGGSRFREWAPVRTRTPQ